MSAASEAALRGVDGALTDAVAKVSETYELCLIDASGDAAKEAVCKAIRDRGLANAGRTYTDMQAAVKLQFPSSF
jgi:hypothetical protein